MKEIAEWLKTVEHLAGTLYKEASDYFRDDKNLSAFLKHLSDDEAWHFHLMGSAAEYFSKTDHQSVITIDNETKKNIESHLIKTKEMLSEKSLTKDEMLRALVDAEYSELNYIFLYIVNILKESRYEFSYGVSKIQQHLNFIENYLKSSPETEKYLVELVRLPRVWEKRILVVDDMMAVIHLLKAVLEEEGEIETALNGKEALEKAGRRYFDLIIADIQMPVMNGIEFFQQLAEQDPRITNNFIFFSSDLTPEAEKLIRDNNLRLLRKPSSIQEIRQTAHEILVK